MISAALTMMLILVVGFTGCENSTILGNTTADPALGIPAEQITWVSWKPGVLEAMEAGSLARGSASKYAKPDKDTNIGGPQTFNNQVTVFTGAVTERTYIEVEVVCVDGNDQCGSGIDFLPNMQFLNDVKVTLSWEFLDVDTLTVDDFEAYYSEDDGATWFEIDDLEIDYDAMTISVYEDHFTRYAWGLSGRSSN